MTGTSSGLLLLAICQLASTAKGQGPPIPPTSGQDSHCDADYILFGDFCYHFAISSYKWQDGESICTRQQGHLVSFHSQEELSFLVAHIPRAPTWTGLNDINSEKQFVFTDGSPVDFLPWGQNQPEDCDESDCVDIRNGMELHDHYCQRRKQFICKIAKGQGPPIPPTSPDSHCDDDYILFGDFWYYFSKNRYSWQAAEDFCVRQQGHLVSFHSQEELSFLVAHMPEAPTWTGLNDINSENQFVFTDASPADFLPWFTNEPNNRNGDENCVEIGCRRLKLGYGKLNDHSCATYKGIICKKGVTKSHLDSGPGADVTPLAPAQPKAECCPSGWMERAGRCFYLSNHTLNWREARSTCQGLGGDLAVILSQDDQDFLTNLVKLLYRNDPNVMAVWIGLDDFEQERRFNWVDGHPLKKELAFWRPGEPNNFKPGWDVTGRGQDCVAISPPFDDINNWDDVICVGSRHFLCEIKAHTKVHTEGCDAI